MVPLLFDRLSSLTGNESMMRGPVIGRCVYETLIALGQVIWFRLVVIGVCQLPSITRLA